MRIDDWRNDMALLATLWRSEFVTASPALQPRFKEAGACYVSWEVAAIINRSAKTFAGRFRAVGLYYHCRADFQGWAGAFNLVSGLIKLWTPEFVKRPMRRLLLAAAQGKEASPR